MCMGRNHSSRGLSHVHTFDLGQCKNVCTTRVSIAASYEYGLTAVIEDFIVTSTAAR